MKSTGMRKEKTTVLKIRLACFTWGLASSE